MPQLEVPIVKTSNLPAGYCYPDPQTFMDDIVSRLIGVFLNNFSGVIISPTAPGVNDRDKLWFNTHLEDNQIYSWVLSIGKWARKYPFPPWPTCTKRIWYMSEADMTADDGGNSNPVAPADGPFWEIDTTMTGRFPLAHGLIPGSVPAVTVNDADTGGSNLVTLTMPNIPYHGHNLPLVDALGNPGCIIPTYENGSDWRSPSDSKDRAQETFRYEGGDPANANATVGHSNMPPYYVGCWGKRSARIWMLPL